MAVAIRIQSDPSSLLSSSGWGPPVFSAVLNQVPGDSQGNPTVRIAIDAYEWDEVTVLGFGNVGQAMTQMRAAIQARGSDLYAYAIFRTTALNLLGVKVVRYRLVMLHSFVELLEWAVAILAIAFAAVIFIQYVTTGQAPALKDLQALWGSAVTSVAQGGQTITSGVTNAYIGWLVGLGGLALVFGLASKESGVKPAKLPGSGSFGVRSGSFSARAGT